MAELEALLLFLQWEEKAFFERWDYMLGLVWTDEDIKALTSGLAHNDGPKSIDDLDKSGTAQEGALRFPLSLLIRPELIEQFKDRSLPSINKAGMPHVPASALSLSDVGKADFLRKLGATPADEQDFSTGDMFDKPHRGSSGFTEGPMRSIGGKRR